MDEARLQPLLELAAKRVADAAHTVVKRRGEAGREEARLDQLGRYLAEYDQHAEITSRWQLVNRSAFLADVRAAIDQQRQVVERAHEASERAIDAWNQQRAEQRRYEALLERERRRNAAAAARREQRALDGISTHHLRSKA